MATGGTILIKEGQEICLFKVRHDGYYLEEYFVDNKKAFLGNIYQVMQDFLNNWNHNYSSPNAEIETNFPTGYFSITKNKLNFLTMKNVYETEGDLEREIEAKNSDDGLLCCYLNAIYIDLDNQLLVGPLDKKGKILVYDKNYKVIKKLN